MSNKYPNQITPRENFLLSLLHKVTKEYKALVEFTCRKKTLKIAEILELSSTPGESKFAIQFTNKNCVLHLTAAEIISQNYHLDDFNEFHAAIIKQAAHGKLIEFLKLSEKVCEYRIAVKRFDKSLQQYVFVIETKEQTRFTRTAEEIAADKKLLLNLDITDVYDIGFTQGCESILKEKAALLLAKHKL